MNPRLRTTLFALAASLLAVWVGFTLANEQHVVAILCAAACVWAVISWTRGARTEAWLIGFLVFGYIIGSRGFAQIAPVAGMPLFLSELGLAFVGALWVFRGALRRTIPVRRDWLNGFLIAWLALGLGRIAWDVRTFGFVALRDFAMVYYALYFFAVQTLAAHEPSRQVLRGALVLTFSILPLTGALAHLFPDFFQSNLLVSGVPLILYKSDLLGTFLFAGFILLLPMSAGRWQDTWWRWIIALGSLVFGLGLLSRSSIVGLIVALGWLAWSGRWRPMRVLLTVCATALLAVTVFSLLQKKDFTQTKAYAVYEAVVSIADYTGTRDYQSEMSSDKGDNNRFRLVWWKNVYQETMATSPVLGMGFGADLALGFLNEYYPTGETDFSARSPHNIFMTTLGRMGLLGVAVLLAVYCQQASSTARAARRARGNLQRDTVITLQAACWVILVSACFGVVLEGPMGAIPFWTMLGLAHFEAMQADDADSADVEKNATPLTAPAAGLG